MSLLIELLKPTHSNENCTKKTVTALDNHILNDIRMSNTVQNDKFYIRNKLEKCSKENAMEDYKTNIPYASEKHTSQYESKSIKMSMNKTQNDELIKVTLSIKDNSDQVVIHKKDKFEGYYTNISARLNNNSNINNDKPLSFDELKIDLIKQIRNLYSKQKYESMRSNSNYFDKSLVNIIIIICKSLSENQEINHEYLQKHIKEIHKIIKSVFEDSNKKSVIISKIVNEMINNKAFLNQINDYDNQYCKTKLRINKATNSQLQNKSNSYISLIKSIYQKVYQMHQENCMEDMLWFSDNCLQKEAQMLIMNKLVTNYLSNTRQNLIKKERYEKKIKNKQAELKALTTI